MLQQPPVSVSRWTRPPLRLGARCRVMVPPRRQSVTSLKFCMAAWQISPAARRLPCMPLICRRSGGVDVLLMLISMPVPKNSSGEHQQPHFRVCRGVGWHTSARGMRGATVPSAALSAASRTCQGGTAAGQWLTDEELPLQNCHGPTATLTITALPLYDKPQSPIRKAGGLRSCPILAERGSVVLISVIHLRPAQALGPGFSSRCPPPPPEL